MKRYLVFGGYHHNAGGGFDDFRGQRDNFEDALTLAKELFRPRSFIDHDTEWWHIVDTHTGHEQDSTSVEWKPIKNWKN